jgi:hypothetical protein|tara:strand:+ start:4840 stop:5313 length:474 start_codon:yes stop_codon:yes gene_type:complete
MLSSKALHKIGEVLAVGFGVTLVKQGRNKKSGGLIDSLHTKILKPNSVSVLGNHYWRFVDKGVRADQIKSPFAPARINALVKWLISKGIGSAKKTTRQIAYAIAHTHGKKGMPTMKGKFDKSRLNFVDKTLLREKKTLSDAINEAVNEEVMTIIKKL